MGLSSLLKDAKEVARVAKEAYQAATANGREVDVDVTADNEPDDDDRARLPPVLVATADLDKCISKCLQRFNKLIAKSRSTGTKFTDAQFPVTTTPNKCLYTCRLMKNEEIPAPSMWKRASEISARPQMFVDGVAAGDIQQGALGSCYFLGALAAIAAHKAHLESLIIAHDFEAGIVAVRFFKNNLWHAVIIDDYIGLASDGSILYARCTDPDEFWVPLLEKAYAKLHGSFESINGGYNYQVIMDMTGGAGYFHRTNELGSAESCFALIASLLRKHAVLAAFMLQNSEDITQERMDAAEAIGVVTNHAYTILRAFETKHGHQLIQLRNPWGQREFTGDWSDTSGMLSKELLKELDHVIAEDGTFWISAEDFMVYFSSDWVVATTSGRFADSDVNTPFFRLESKAKQAVGKSIIVLSQKDRRIEMAASLLSIPVVPLSLSVYRCLEGDYNPRTRSFGELLKEYNSRADAPTSQLRELVVEVDLDPRYVYTLKVNAPTVDGKRVGVYCGRGISFFLRVFATMDIRLEEPSVPDFRPKFPVGTAIAFPQTDDEGNETEAYVCILRSYRDMAPNYVVTAADDDQRKHDVTAQQMKEGAACYKQLVAQGKLKAR
ncbi:hypothetical protein JKP88DRAFT_333556 [Tribonema minus]|uniref:Calpain catalytic domain-containing protein n=1 Tax=Tribonema minus TaxID=303371 RepID=A0A835YKV9_9STRA|nr:hypothetical protein JKP88DRAFT_333556 [Tribonema minus]